MSAPEEPRSAADRYRRAAFRIAAAARDLSEAAAAMSTLTGGVVPAAVEDVEYAKRLLADLPAVRVQKPARRS